MTDEVAIKRLENRARVGAEHRRNAEQQMTKSIVSVAKTLRRIGLQLLRPSAPLVEAFVVYREATTALWSQTAQHFFDVTLVLAELDTTIEGIMTSRGSMSLDDLKGIAAALKAPPKKPSVDEDTAAFVDSLQAVQELLTRHSATLSKNGQFYVVSRPGVTAKAFESLTDAVTHLEGL